MMNFGSDFLILNGEFVWEGDNLATVSGEDNVKQQAYLRLITDLGESVFFADYGSRLQMYLSKPFNEENKKKAEAEAKATLLRVGDGWIEQVLECRIELEDTSGKKILFAKYFLQGENTPREISHKMEVI
ncbi:DUF2634 domain-containing protein [Paenibacillus ehimensis]|uniref:DUF2634 domain-containing protein n=1 Tax=Paenibacillus ehimensis TaxID=79264 RepID=A0ABT8VI29_9BACL|nr:DUF2634 domain-containing protein [Paenibacillus ehimensis]MDO3680643.1 DUF2634 domain-containing protein [Paenibacillus ehimensis]